ncbi:MAG: lipoprotein insertase outer membrane protein LolB [Candidatus Endonucleobacter sp. (ex Gigantidas childressi)]|nr:lipoprotein insertase outer membrane protein LolB [Candidatus Endonucleobacter sp. (ex Gigantidas childressi)]
MSLMLNINRRWVLLVVLLLLSGCTTLKKSVPLSDTEKKLRWQKNKQQILKINNWQLAGRLGLLVPGQSGSVSLLWIQENDTYTLSIDGPFGLSLVHIKGNSAGVTAEISGEEQPLKSMSPEDLMMQITGWDLPVSGLKYWVRGLPTPDFKSKVTFNNEGQTSIIDQGGWIITYESYRDEKSVSLPARMKVNSDKISLKLIIKDWQLHLPEVIEGTGK